MAVGPTGIWCIEIKNWRGIVYPGEDRETLYVKRQAKTKAFASQRVNPFLQLKRHSEDLLEYFRDTVPIWLPLKRLVVFSKYDQNGKDGINLNPVRDWNPSLCYLKEMPFKLTARNERVAAGVLLALRE